MFRSQPTLGVRGNFRGRANRAWLLAHAARAVTLVGEPAVGAEDGRARRGLQLDQVRAAPDKATGATHTLAGRFTIRGVTKSIRFPATITQTRPFSARAEFSINRKDFGMMYDGKADNLIRDGVVMKIDLRAKG